MQYVRFSLHGFRPLLPGVVLVSHVGVWPWVLLRLQGAAASPKRSSGVRKRLLSDIPHGGCERLALHFTQNL